MKCEKDKIQRHPTRRKFVKSDFTEKNINKDINSLLLFGVRYKDLKEILIK